MSKMAEQLIARDYDIVICLVDMDRILANPTELATYKRIKAKSCDRILWIETNPCTEFWFLLHFLPDFSIKYYKSCDELLPVLQKYMPGYEKTTHYFKKTKLYEYLQTNGDLRRAIQYSERLSRLSEESPEDKIAYSQIGRVLNLLAEYSGFSNDSKNLKTANLKRIGKVEANIIGFLANNPDSDVKSISKAIGLRPSRTADYLKQLLSTHQIECSEGWKKRYCIRGETKKD